MKIVRIIVSNLYCIEKNSHIKMLQNIIKVRVVSGFTAKWYPDQYVIYLYMIDDPYVVRTKAHLGVNYVSG